MQTNAPLAVTFDSSDYSQQQVIRRNGKLTRFDPSKIQVAVTRAFLAVEGGHASDSHRVRDIAEQLTTQVIDALFRRLTGGGTIHIEDIQDQVELALMRNGHHKIARAYVLYREAHHQQRQLESEVDTADESEKANIHITMADGTKQLLRRSALEAIVNQACAGLDDVDEALILKEALRNIYDGIAEKDVATVLVMSARILIEQEPNYAQVSARLLLDSLRQEVLSFLSMGPQPHIDQVGMTQLYADYFGDYIRKAAELELLDRELTRFDLVRLGQAIKPERDLKFTYLGLQTLYDRYFIHSDNHRLELPQAFFMRVAMGLAINEIDREGRAIEFYELLSSFDFMSSTPTLFNSGTLRPQLSSCYLSTVPDELEGIYNA
ncbi:Ribonucleotide reductase of class Ia (aerobic), alpha subunit, partial [hydrothermal vent metagenome]